jgi:hypothetical protein
VKDLRIQIFDKIIHYNLRQFDRTPIGTLTTRTVNDIYSAALPNSPAIVDNNFLDNCASTATVSLTNPYFNPPSHNQTTGVTGAVKTVLVGDKASLAGAVDSNNGVLTSSCSFLNGIGFPAFVYFDPAEAVATELGFGNYSTATACQYSSNKQTKITFVVRVPDQTTATGVDTYNPYNGVVIKEVGLFNDAIIPAVSAGVYGVDSTVNGVLTTANTIITPDNATGTQHAPYKMPFGTLWAHRKIKPIYKDKDVSIEVRWTIYFDETV